MTAENLSRELENMIGESGIKVPGLGVIIYCDGKEIFSKFLGRRTIAPDKPVTRHTRFRVASVSKMFTIFTILQLVEQGKIKLDEEASDYLGFELRNPNFPAEPITIEMLASHLSSLRDGQVYSAPPEVSLREFFTPEGRYWEGGSHFAGGNEGPGKYFTYCNLNYGVLGTIIERVTGKRFDVYQRENILRQLNTRADYVPSNLAREEFDLLGTIYRKKNPAGEWNEFGDWYAQMDDFDGVQPERDTLALQNPYSERFNEIVDLKNYRVGTNATFFSPQGGLRISFDELAHALEMLLNNGRYQGKTILTPTSFANFLTPRWFYVGESGTPSAHSSFPNCSFFPNSTRPPVNVHLDSLAAFRVNASLQAVVARRKMRDSNSLTPIDFFSFRRFKNKGRGDSCGGAILNYALGNYLIDVKNVNLHFKNSEFSLCGHAGQAFGLFSGLFFIPLSRIGFVYMMNGEALFEETALQSFGVGYIWEAKILNCILNFLNDIFL